MVVQDWSFEKMGVFSCHTCHTYMVTRVMLQDWSFEKMGVGGLDQEFQDIFRRAFASRIFPVSVLRKLGIQHVKYARILAYLPYLHTCILASLHPCILASVHPCILELATLRLTAAPLHACTLHVFTTRSPVGARCLAGAALVRRGWTP